MRKWMLITLLWAWKQITVIWISFFLEDHYNNNHFQSILCLFSLLSISLSISLCLLFSLFLRPIQSEEEIKQLSIPSSKEKEEEEIWPPKKSVSGSNIRWWSGSIFLLFIFFPSPSLVGRIIKPQLCETGFPIISVWILANEPLDTAIAGSKGND